MRVTLVSPTYHNIWEALWAGYLVAYIKKNYKKQDIQFNFFHGNFDDLNAVEQDDLTLLYSLEMSTAARSDIVGISCTTPTYPEAIRIAKLLKSLNKKVHIVLGGWHPTVVGEIEDDCVDQIVIGEGEAAFLEIIKGNKDKVVYGERLSFSRIPWPDRTIIKYGRQVDWCEKEFGERIASIQSVRGCKMGCAMCAEKCMSGKYNSKTNPLRLRLPKDTLDEVDSLRDKYKIQRFKFVDPTWSVDDDYVYNFCYEKIRRGNYLPWDAMVHAGIATEFSIRMMSKATCDTIMVGCESGNQGILNDIHKGLTVEKIKKVFEWGKKYGLKRRAFFMLGMPNESLESIRDTIQLIRDIDPDVVGFTILCPYPGTAFYDKEKFKNVDWSKADEYENDFWETKNFTNQQLKEFQRVLCKMFEEKLPWHQRQFMRKYE